MKRGSNMGSKKHPILLLSYIYGIKGLSELERSGPSTRQRSRVEFENLAVPIVVNVFIAVQIS
jgi:hypothetical protein